MARMSRPWRSGRRRGRAAHRATYSRWDGTQQVPDLDADALLKAMGDELIEHGDPNEALRRMMNRGLSFEGGRLNGLRTGPLFFERWGVWRYQTKLYNIFEEIF